MKTGELAAILGVSQVTVRAWVQNPVLERFFSTAARGKDGLTQRTYTESDVLVCNTIRHLRANNQHITWDEMAEYLDSGAREQEFPAHAIGSDMRTVSVHQAETSARAAATLAERDAALARVDELSQEIERLRTEIKNTENQYRAILESEQRAHRETTERLMREIADLNRKIGALEAQKGQF